MNDELYEYINKKKQSVVKQYDLLLERIQLSKNPKSAIALMCDEEFIVREPQYPISELLYLMSVFIDEYYKDNELFQDCTKELTDEYITYAKEKYSIQFSAPFRYSSEIIVRYHAQHVMHPSFPVHPEIWDTASKMREELIDFYRHKSIKRFLRINRLMYHTYYENGNYLKNVLREYDRILANIKKNRFVLSATGKQLYNDKIKIEEVE